MSVFRIQWDHLINIDSYLVGNFSTELNNQTISKTSYQVDRFKYFGALVTIDSLGTMDSFHFVEIKHSAKQG